MKNEIILKKVIEKAVKNGWTMWNMVGVKSTIVNEKRCSWSGAKEFGIGFFGGGVFTLNDIIFSHKFAKAFWGEEEWGYQLQQMVLEKEPLKYLEKFL